MENHLLISADNFIVDSTLKGSSEAEIERADYATINYLNLDISLRAHSFAFSSSTAVGDIDAGYTVDPTLNSVAGTNLPCIKEVFATKGTSHVSF